MKLDAIDRRIPRTLQRNGRLQNVELAEETGLSPPPAWASVPAGRNGVIERYVAVLNAAKVGMGLAVFMRPAEGAIQQLPQVVECHLMAGDCDFLLRVVARTWMTIGNSSLGI
jgi:DNA-binding Lrp family transcriptional regulator